jgi:glycosyltransferase involved in cell wall biosynthesis
LPLIDKWCLGRAKIIITVSNFSKEFLVGYGVKPEYIKVIYNGIDIKELEKKAKDTDIKEELHLDKDTQIVCYAGRIVKWKNLEMLIQAIPEVKVGYPGKAKFLFVGETPKIKEKEMDYNDTLLKLAQQLNVRDEVIFTGRRDDIASILKRIDIFAISSYLEVCSMSILEAMAIGKPIVAIRSGGNPELITKETGILVEPGDIDSFARAIIDLLEDEGKKVRMGNAAKNEIEVFFNIENNVNRLEEIMIHLAKSPCLKGELI